MPSHASNNAKAAPQIRRHREARAAGRSDLRSPRSSLACGCCVAQRAPRSDAVLRGDAISPLTPGRRPQNWRHREARVAGRGDLTSPLSSLACDCRVPLQAPRNDAVRMGRRIAATDELATTLKRRHCDARAAGRGDLRSPRSSPVPSCRVFLRAPRSAPGGRVSRPATATSPFGLLAVTPFGGAGGTPRLTIWRRR